VGSEHDASLRECRRTDTDNGRSRQMLHEHLVTRLGQQDRHQR
jgi:hypothetical protein